MNMSTAFHPQTDGETERVNQELEIYLRKYCGTKQHEWDKYLKNAEFAFNCQKHSVTSQLPFYLWYGYQPNNIPKVSEDTNVPKVKD